MIKRLSMAAIMNASIFAPARLSRAISARFRQILRDAARLPLPFDIGVL